MDAICGRIRWRQNPGRSAIRRYASGLNHRSQFYYPFARWQAKPPRYRAGGSRRISSKHRTGRTGAPGPACHVPVVSPCDHHLSRDDLILMTNRVHCAELRLGWDTPKIGVHHGAGRPQEHQVAIQQVPGAGPYRTRRPQRRPESRTEPGSRICHCGQTRQDPSGRIGSCRQPGAGSVST